MVSNKSTLCACPAQGSNISSDYRAVATKIKVVRLARGGVSSGTGLELEPDRVVRFIWST